MLRSAKHRDQHIQMITDDGLDIITFTIPEGSSRASEIVNETNKQEKHQENFCNSNFFSS